MAKPAISKGATSRIRFIMLEAELPEGDLSQITSAIQNALKPATTVVQQRLITHAQTALEASTPLQDGDGLGDIADPGAGAVEENPSKAPTRESRPRKPVSMKVLELDLTSGTLLTNFAANINRKAMRNETSLLWPGSRNIALMNRSRLTTSTLAIGLSSGHRESRILQELFAT